MIKKLFFLACLLMPAPVWAQTPGLVDLNQLFEKLRPAPTRKDFEAELAKLRLKKDNFDDPATFTGFKMTDPEQKKSINFDDLSDFEKSCFCFGMGGKISNEAKTIDNLWKKELKRFEKQDYVPLGNPDAEDEKDRPATKEDIEVYLKDLTQVRKEFAEKYESFTADFLEQYKDQIEPEERKMVMARVVDFHDKEHLITRNTDGK